MKYRALKNFIFDSAYFEQGAVYELDPLPAPLKDGYFEKIGNAEPLPPETQDPPKKEEPPSDVDPDVDDVMQMPDLGNGKSKTAKRK